MLNFLDTCERIPINSRRVHHNTLWTKLPILVVSTITTAALFVPLFCMMGSYFWWRIWRSLTADNKSELRRTQSEPSANAQGCSNDGTRTDMWVSVMKILLEGEYSNPHDVATTSERLWKRLVIVWCASRINAFRFLCCSGLESGASFISLQGESATEPCGHKRSQIFLPPWCSVDKIWEEAKEKMGMRLVHLISAGASPGFEWRHRWAPGVARKW